MKFDPIVEIVKFGADVLTASPEEEVTKVTDEQGNEYTPLHD